MTMRSSSISHVPVCHVVYAKFPADPRVRREVRTLESVGFTVDVLCLRSDVEDRAEVMPGVRVRRLPLGPRRGSRLRYAYQYVTFFLLVSVNLVVAHAFRRYRIIHVHSLPDFLILAAVPCRALGARLVLDLHESMPEIYRARFPRFGGSFVERLSVLVQRVSCAFANRTITVNPTIGAILESRGVPRERIVVVENSPDWPVEIGGPKPELVSGDSAEITIVGGLNPERDLRLVLTAAKRLREIVRIQVRWRIIGPGEPSFVQALRDQVSRLGIEDVVTIEGEVPATLVPSILARATVGVVSYQRNPLTEIATPNKAYEYAVGGKAMVFADLPALRRLLGDTVRYYNPGNAEDLALNVQWLLEHPSERGLLELAARQRIAGHRWEIMADRLIRVYQECLATDGVFPRFEPGRENSSEPTWRPSDGR